MSGTVDREGYRYIPGPFQYSGGVAAAPGFAIERVRFANPVPLAEAFRRIEAFLRNAALPLTTFCACELRSPRRSPTRTSSLSTGTMSAHWSGGGSS
jgi:hypothetical protein